MPTALVFGVTGQSGFYLTRLLIEHDYQVVGVKRRVSNYNNEERLSQFLRDDNFKLVEGDITDYQSVSHIIKDTNPDFLYNLAAQSHVHTSFEQPNYTFQTIVDGTLNILETIRTFCPNTHFVTASSSEMFGSSCDADGFQRETTPFKPCSPYAVAKLAAHNLIDVYRRSYGLKASSAIFFNMESALRGAQFVTQKIVKHVALYKHALGQSSPFTEKEFDYLKKHVGILKLGNINAKRSWQHCEDAMRAMYMMSLADKPDDYVVSAPDTYSVHYFLSCLLEIAGFPRQYWDRLYQIDKSLFRPCEVPYLRGDSSKIKKQLGWESKISFEELIKDMYYTEYRRLYRLANV